MKFLKLILTICLVLQGTYLMANAVSGSIRASVFDGDTGEALIGANVVIKGTINGSVTDLDGNATIRNLEPGAYDIEVSYISYQTTTVSGLEVKEGDVISINISLQTESMGLEEVVVQATAIRTGEAALLTVKRKSANLLDAISAETFSKTGDGDAGSAMKRITGVSVEGGKYVYVRGLGDRYSKTSLNGAEIPGLDPNRNTVQMDLFPTNLIDNIIVYKSFSPELPGSFTGGYVNVETKDFPEEKIFQLSGSLSGGQANKNDAFLSYEGGATDWLGFDDGTRDFPNLGIGEVPTFGEALSSPAASTELANITKSFNKVLTPESQNQFLNHSFSTSYGNSKFIGDKELGFIASLSYSRGFEHYDDGFTGRYKLLGVTSNVLNEELALNDQQSTDEVLWGAMLSGALKLNPYNKIKLNLLRNQSGTSTVRIQEGTKPSDDVALFFQTSALMFQERALNTAQLQGEHAFNEGQGISMDWIASYTISSSDEPDLRFFTNGYRLNEEGTPTYKIEPSIGQIPTRFSRSMNENNLDLKVNFSVPFTNWSGLASKFKFGGAYLIKDREFREFTYGYANNSNAYNGDPISYVSDGNVLDFYGNDFDVNGVYIQDNYQERNNYDATQTVAAGYAMVELPIGESVRLIAGARAESTDIELVSFDETLDPSTIDDFDILPALNLTKALGEKTNLRLAYGRTLARPTFREIAPFAAFDFVGDFIKVGNDTLKRTLVDNFDIRWETYPGRGEIISVSGFYKKFQNPIEIVDNPLAPNAELVYRNVPEATLYGIELEMKKNLGFLGTRFENFNIGSNVAVIRSIVDINPTELVAIRSSDQKAKDTRAMFGQSPYIVNAYLNFENEKHNASLYFNVQGERLAVVIKGSTPNVYEQPRPSLNFSYSQRLSDKWKAKVAVNNILNSPTRFTQEFDGVSYDFQSFTSGATGSIGVSYSIN